MAQVSRISSATGYLASIIANGATSLSAPANPLIFGRDASLQTRVFLLSKDLKRPSLVPFLTHKRQGNTTAYWLKFDPTPVLFSR